MPDSTTEHDDGNPVTAAADVGSPKREQRDTLKLYAEDVKVGRETVDVARVKVAKHTHTREEVIDEALRRESVEVVTVPIGRRIEAMPPVREEGDTTIVPIVEEVLVVERHLMLKEEVHIRRISSTERHRETVTLRYQEAEIERTVLDGSGAAPAATGFGKGEDV